MEIEGEEHQFESTKCSTSAIVTFVLGLFAGTFSAIFCKAAYETTVVYDGQTKLFAKPIFMLLLMFASMVPAIFFWLIQQATLKPKDRDTLTYRSMIILIIPCFCDLLCTLLLLVAQLYITASMWQMLRGSIICITAVLKRFVLNHRLRTHMWYGVFIITASMTVVASVPFFTPDTSGKAGTDKDPRIGVVLVILGCFAQGVQYVFEEKVMAVDNVPPLVVIGFEGMWGTLLTLLFVYPLAYAIPGSDVGGVYENPWDAIAMIKSSPFLQNILIGFVITVTLYNCLVVYVTKYLSAIWHAILDNFRPLTIWTFGLFIHYSINPNFGEAWEAPGSYIQMVGLLFLFLGTAVYDGKITLCDDTHEYRSIAQADGPAKKVAQETSSSLTKSPLVYRRDRESLPIEGAGGAKGKKVGYTDLA